MEILADRAEWEAAFRAGWLDHFQRTGVTDFKQYNRPKTALPRQAVPSISPQVVWC
jgi:hypothetical protein